MTMLLIILVAIPVIFYSFFQWRYKYWKQQNVPYLEPRMPFGSLEAFLKLKSSSGREFQRIYQHFKSLGHVHGGFYFITNRSYIPVDRMLIKSILTKDFHHFIEKDEFINEKDQPISGHLFNIGGETWRKRRRIATGAFTSGRMKIALNRLMECKKPFFDQLAQCAKKKTPLDIKEAAYNFATDSIGSVALGIDCNSFTNPEAEFRKVGRLIFRSTYFGLYKSAFQFFFQGLSRKLRLFAFPPAISDIFTKAITDVMRYKRKAGIQGNDILELLMIKRSDEQQVDQTSMDEIIAMTFSFFLAGFQTSSTTIYFCLFELAQHQDVQDKVREEMHTVLDNNAGEITYQGLTELKYMKQVIDETLRKYPPIPVLDRKCTKDYKVPGTDVTLKPGTTVAISSLGLHMDPEYFPDPEKFDPERFSETNIGNIKPFSYLPFGEGPRMCIGQRFGLMEIKVALITLLKDFRYTLNEKTNPNLEFTPNFVNTAKGEILLDVVDIKCS